MTYMDEIKPHREAIDRLNNEIIALIAERQREALAIGGIKKKHGNAKLVDIPIEENI